MLWTQVDCSEPRSGPRLGGEERTVEASEAHRSDAAAISGGKGACGRGDDFVSYFQRLDPKIERETKQA